MPPLHPRGAAPDSNIDITFTYINPLAPGSSVQHGLLVPGRCH